jgi:hypothetical protein
MLISSPLHRMMCLHYQAHLAVHSYNWWLLDLNLLCTPVTGVISKKRGEPHWLSAVLLVEDEQPKTH